METPDTLQSKQGNHTLDGAVQSSPCRSRTRTPMSASLKAKLKRARRPFTSPFSVAKRLKVDSDEEEVATSGKTGTDTDCVTACMQDRVDMNRDQIAEKTCPENVTSGAESDLSSGDPALHSETDFVSLREKLRKAVREKTEKLRRLKMVKMYREKNDLTQLQSLISKWRRCSQAVLYELQCALSEDSRKASLSQLIDHFGLDEDILHFDRTEDDFTDF
ncbi:hypothetical protein GJAV_G00238680 [Gymnothorax javanicus]|nr:hypothetical protein GJAV_G00238680 [Gymnothorax javanicus]